VLGGGRWNQRKTRKKKKKRHMGKEISQKCWKEGGRKKPIGLPNKEKKGEDWSKVKKSRDQ